MSWIRKSILLALAVFVCEVASGQTQPFGQSRLSVSNTFAVEEGAGLHIVKAHRSQDEGDHVAALFHIERAVEQSGDSAALFFLKGESLRRLGIDLEAIAAYTAGLKLDPQHAPSYNGRAMASWRLAVAAESMHDRDAAVKAYRQMMQDAKLAPKGRNRVLMIAIAGFEIEDYRASIMALTSLIANADSPKSRAQFLDRRSEAFERVQAPDLAVADRQKAVKLFPTKKATMQLLASLEEMKRWDQMLILIDELLVESPNDLTLLINRLGVLAERGEHSEAIEGFRKLVAANSGNAALVAGLEKAIERVRSLAERPATPPPVDAQQRAKAQEGIRRARELFAKEEFAEAQKVAYAAWRMDMSDSEAALLLVDCAIQTQNFNVMMATSSWVVQQDVPDSHWTRAMGLAKFNMLPVALFDIEAACKENPTATGFVLRGRVLRELYRFEEALAAYEEARRLGCDAQTFHSGRAMALGAAGNLDQAIEEYTLCANAGSKDASIRMLRAGLYEKTGQYSLAKNDYEEAISLAKDDATTVKTANSRVSSMVWCARAQEHMSKFIGASARARAELTRAMIAPPEICRKVFRQPFADQVADAYAKAAEANDMEIAPAADTDTVLVDGCKTEMISALDGSRGEGPWSLLGEELLPGNVLFGVGFAREGRIDLSIDGLINVDGEWYFFPQAWRLLESETLTKRQDEAKPVTVP